MSSATHQIESLAAEAERKQHTAEARADRSRKEAERAERDAERHAAEKEAYRNVLRMLSSDTDGRPKPELPKADERPQASDKWNSIYSALYLMGDDPPYDYAALAQAAKDAGFDVSTGGLRTQMMNAVNSGLFQRVGAGKFEFTEMGLEAIGAQANENEAPEGASETGEASPVEREDDLSDLLSEPRLTAADPAPHSGGEGG